MQPRKKRRKEKKHVTVILPRLSPVPPWVCRFISLHPLEDSSCSTVAKSSTLCIRLIIFYNFTHSVRPLLHIRPETLPSVPINSEYQLSQPISALRQGPAVAMATSFTHVVVVSHVHPTVQHDVFASDGDEDAAAAHILSSTLEEHARAQ